MNKNIIVQKSFSTQGTSKSGRQYTKTDIISTDNEKFVTFVPTDVVEGGEYAVEYKPNKFNGFDLISIKPIKVPTKADIKLDNKNKQNSIIRQHSQEMAIRYFDMMGYVPENMDKYKEMVDWFVDDANNSEEPF